MTSPQGKVNLTKKFSRHSLRKATGHETAKVHSCEEELARATTKRFNSESWKTISKAYRPLPNPNITQNASSNTQILYAMSSLTEDPAFQAMRSENSAASTSYGTAREVESRSPIGTTREVESGSPRQQSSKSGTAGKSSTVLTPGGVPIAMAGLSRPTTGSKAAAKTKNAVARTAARNTRAAISKTTPSLRSAAGSIPKLRGRKLGKSALNDTTQKSGQQPAEASEVRPVEESPIPKETSSIDGSSQNICPQKPLAKSLNEEPLFNSTDSFFVKIFKFLHYIFFLPLTLPGYLTKQTWSVEGKSVLITDASSGVGKEIAHQYAEQGAKLALVARTSEDIEKVSKECAKLGAAKSSYYAADLSNPVSTKLAMKQALADHGNFDVVILNSSRSQGCYFEEIKDPTQIENMIKLNVNGTITSLHYVLPKVPKTRESRIVVISNTAGIVAVPCQSIYSATKHALTGFTNSLRIELSNTYGSNSPQVCLVSFPEIFSTTYDASSQMDMGARLPPAKWYSWAGIPQHIAVQQLLPAIAAGKREFGQPWRFNLRRAMYNICPDWVDSWMMKEVQKARYRPFEERQRRPALKTHLQGKKRGESKLPTNRSWD